MPKKTPIEVAFAVHKLAQAVRMAANEIEQIAHKLADEQNLQNASDGIENIFTKLVKEIDAIGK